MFVYERYVWFLVLVNIGLFRVTLEQGIEIENFIRFPYGSPYVGMFVAIAVPIDLTGPADVFFSMNFEASYSLPTNQTSFVFPPIINSTSTREFVYRLLEAKIDSHGYPGKGCLLRAVCEAAQYTTKNMGILGDILHIVLTPSSSRNETNIGDYAESEEYGRNKGHCKVYKEL